MVAATLMMMTDPKVSKAPKLIEDDLSIKTMQLIDKQLNKLIDHFTAELDNVSLSIEKSKIETYLSLAGKLLSYDQKSIA